ncbi:hypothetical protein RRG08_037838, partial [Elysia crispata]
GQGKSISFTPFASLATKSSVAVGLKPVADILVPSLLEDSTYDAVIRDGVWLCGCVAVLSHEAEKWLGSSAIRLLSLLGYMSAPLSAPLSASSQTALSL